MQPTSHTQTPSRVQTVFLDRDGVINQKMPEGEYVRATDDFHILPSAAEAIGRLNQFGVRVIVVSNQRGIALGLYSAEDVHAIHEVLQRTLGELDARVDAFYFCPHDKGECSCRKPQTGLYDQAVIDFPDIKPGSSVMVGDSLSDIEFGRQAGMQTIFIEGNPQNRRAGTDTAMSLADFTCASLSEAVDALIERDFTL